MSKENQLEVETNTMSDLMNELGNFWGDDDDDSNNDGEKGSSDSNYS